MNARNLVGLLERVRNVLFELEQQTTSLREQQQEQLRHLRLEVDRAIEDVKAR